MSAPEGRARDEGADRPSPSDPMPALRGWVAEHWHEWTGSAGPPGPALVLRGRRPGRAALLIGVAGGSAPAVAVKVRREPLDRRRLDDERRVLETLRGALPADGRVGAPEPHGACELPGASALALRAVPGRRLQPPHLDRLGPAGRRVLRRYVRAVAALSGALAAHAPTGEPAADTGHLAGLAEAFAAVCPDAAAAERALSFADALRSHEVSYPRVWQHGDPAVSNILVHRGRASFIDWETARPGQPPWLDLASVPAALVHGAATQRGTSAYSQVLMATFGDATPTGAILASELGRGWPHELPLGWAVTLSAMDLALRPVADGGAPVPHGLAVASALLADDECRRAVSWAAPVW